MWVLRRIDGLFARIQQQLTVNGPPLHRPIILSARDGDKAVGKTGPSQG